MEIHYGKHHRTYYDKMNDSLKGSEAAVMSIERLLGGISSVGQAVQNNAGGYYNHNIFWTSISPSGGKDPTGALGGEISAPLTVPMRSKKKWPPPVSGVFGSGFAWLILQNRKLKVVSTPNQDNPMMDVVDEASRGTPLLALDVWEHAYYLNIKIAVPITFRRFGMSPIGKAPISALKRDGCGERQLELIKTILITFD